MEFNQSVLVTGIGTDVGKTLVCEALCLKFDMPYWKPIQCGLDQTDTDRIQAKGIQVKPEAYALKAPLSPHHAAQLEGIEIDIKTMTKPEIPTIIEGAGGLMVPMNHQLQTFADLALKLDVPVILVTRNYLGSINHTLLTLEIIKAKGIKLMGVIVSGRKYEEGEKVYIDAGAKIIGRIAEQENDEAIKLEWYG